MNEVGFLRGKKILVVYLGRFEMSKAVESRVHVDEELAYFDTTLCREITTYRR